MRMAALRYRTRNLLRYLDGFSHTCIMVVGDIMIDQYIWGKVDRISPEAPVPVVEVTSESLLLGGAANVVHNIHTLDAKCCVCGVVGNDDMGKHVMGLLQALGIANSGVLIEEDRPTTIKTRVIAHSQQVVRYDRESRKEISDASVERLMANIRHHIDEVDGVIISDYGKGVISQDLLTELLSLARDRGKIVTVDPKVSHFTDYQGVTAITPNHQEAEQAAGIFIHDENSLIRAGQAIRDRLNCDMVLITRGEMGMTLIEKENKIAHIPTSAREVFDVTGAGDTVIASFTLALATGAPSAEAAVISNFAAGAVVGEIGTACVSLEALRGVIRSRGLNKAAKIRGGYR